MAIFPLVHSFVLLFLFFPKKSEGLLVVICLVTLQVWAYTIKCMDSGGCHSCLGSAGSCTERNLLV